MAGDLDIVGVVGVDVVPVAPMLHTRLKAMVLPIATRVGEEAGERMGDAISRKITISIPDAITTGGKAATVAATRQGNNTGGAFARSLRAKLEQAFRSMPKLDVKLSDTGVDAELARVRAKLEALSNKRIGIDVDAETARAHVAELEAELRRLGAAHPNVAVRVDTAAARAALAAFREEIDAATADPATIRIETDGALGARIRAAVREAEASLPNINIDADTSPAQREIAALRARLTSMRDLKIGVDIDAPTALAQINEIQARLRALSAQRATQVDVDTGRARAAITNLNLMIDRLRGRTPTVDVRVDAAAAEARLAAVQHQVNDLDRDDVHIFVRANTAQAHAALLQLSVALGVVAFMPIVPVAAAGLGAIASAALVAAAGVGSLALVAVPAIKGVTSVIQAKTAAEKEAASATDKSAAASVKAAQQALQMASAQQALTSAHRNAAKSIAQANRQVEDAERALGQAAARAMEQREQAAKNVSRAERSLVDAQRSAERAERSLIDAQLDATKAQQDLNRAREDAAQRLSDLQDQLERGKLDEREATLRVREAQEELNKTQREFDAGKATELQLQRAQLAYDQSVQAAAQQKKDYAQLQKDAEAAKKAGVSGSEEVKSAAERLANAQRNVQDETQAVADAHRNVADQVEAVADAQKDAAKAQVDAAQTVADAQRAMSDAVQNAADTQVQAAESIESAERGVESARLSAIDTTAKATSKADEYREALAKLTPEQRDLYDSIAGPGGLTEAYKEWAKSLSPDVVPLFTRMVDGAKRSLPGLTPLVKNSADAVGELMDRASADMKGDPFWDRFKKGVAENAKPAIVGLGISFGNVFKGMAGVLDAFFPHMDSISERMQRITKRFADWGTGLRGSPEFEKFLDYSSEHGPMVAETLGDLAEAFLDLAKALQPFSEVVMEALQFASDGISYVAEHAPWAIQLLYGLWVATKLWTLAMSMSPIGRVITGLFLLALGIKYAWDHFEWFRDIVTGAWEGIQSAADVAWNDFLKPAFEGIRDGAKWVGDKLVWLWKEIFVPAWDIISYAVRVAVAIILTAAITPLWLGIQGIGLLAWWLWTDCFKPTWDLIAGLAVWVWENALKPFFQWVWDGLKWVGDKFVWLYEYGIRPTFDWISAKASWLWTHALQPFFKWVWDGLKWVGDKFVWLYDHSIGPVAGWIADKSDWLWEKGLKPAFDLIKDGVGLVADAFEDAKKAIGIAWDKVKDIAKGPVNFIIEWVYTKGIKAVWDKVAGFVGLDKLPTAPKLLEAGGTVGNGWGVAAPMKVNKPTAIVGEGDPRYPEYVIPTDPKYRSRAVALHQQAGTQLLESGGVIGGAWDWTKDTVSDVVGTGVDWAKAAADLMTNPSKIWDKLVAPVLSKVKDGVGDSPMGKVLTKIPTKIVTGLKDKIVDAVSSLTSENGGWGGEWQKPVNANFGTKFGVPGSMWASGHHTGLDFPAATGTPIKAVANGRVSLATSGGPYGKHVIIDHGGGLQSLYAHMSRIRTTVPKSVNGGSRIGDVGATGNTTGPHLHLEARLNGKAVDPMKYLSGGGGGAQAVGAAQQYAKGILSQYGWGPSQFSPLKKLWDGESNWRWNAENPSSGAYGIPQALPPDKMRTAGADWRTNAKTQIRWGLSYIKGRPDYGSPAAAYSKWLSRSPHWYDDGGYLPPGLSLVANGTGRPEPVFTGSQWDDIRSAKSGGSAEVHAHVRVYVGDREITDIVRTEIDTYDASTATDLNNGRWV
ncbi:peptidoglycan DD-metalloendopeptidase family protein [Streptomyces sp. SID5910]|uniref:aggregation-promoting factor C-terminal-like domain-containing protein n=1 Tax=Streptomyces sp. SID5910 TaxID=2690312 RepID=UPI00136D929B|nr:peptidoglycan DD-metalloendopeptidase family protein [Streptomyces sp. SID5910]MYR43067.1 peptidoglycan DD-metalloendopeptidase family protein [Streptomyces sp. SID5910]